MMWKEAVKGQKQEKQTEFSSPSKLGALFIRRP
jgi:hypothetical protein